MIVPDTGGGFGGKHTGEAAIEAAHLARAAGNARLVALDARGGVHLGLFPAGGAHRDPRRPRCRRRAGRLGLYQRQCGRLGHRVALCDCKEPVALGAAPTAPLRQGSYRALAATANHFARESFMDELAHAAQADPLAFRLAHLKNDRLRAVLEKAAKEFGWADRRRQTADERRRGAGLRNGERAPTWRPAPRWPSIASTARSRSAACARPSSAARW